MSIFHNIRNRTKQHQRLDDLEEQCQQAIDLCNRKQYTEAENLQRQVWQARQDILGHENSTTLKSQYHLAWISGQLKKYEDAEILYRQAWQTEQRIYGQEDPETLSSQHNLAVTLIHLKRYEEAEMLSRQTWQIRQRVLGEGSVQTQESLISLSHTAFRLEKYALALELDQNVLSRINLLPLQERKKVKWVATLNLAQSFYENGYDHKAEKMFYEFLQIGIKNDPEQESIARLGLAVVKASTPLPSIDAALMQSEIFPSGGRFLETINCLSAGHKSSSPPGPRDNFSQETLSFVTCQESKTFLENLVSRAESDVISIETTISTVQNDDVIPTVLELDIYYAEPNQTSFMTRDGHLDTKAGADYISSDLVELLGHRVYPYNGARIHTAAGAIKPLGQISIFFEWRKSSKLRKRTFLVIEDLPFDIILGIKFITEFEVYSIGNTLLVMALSPLSKEEKKQMKIRAAENRKRRDAEEKLEEEQNRKKRMKKSLARESEANTSKSVSGLGGDLDNGTSTETSTQK